MKDTYIYGDVSVANKTLNWYSFDDAELYQKNLKTKNKELKQTGYTRSSIQYQFNSFGFRGSEFIEQPNIIFLGCSNTFGLGINYNETWPFIVANSLKLKCYNLGVCGASNDTAFRLGSYWIPRLKPTAVIWLRAFKERFEVLYKDNVEIYRADITKTYLEIDMYKKWIIEEDNTTLHLLKNTYALAHICDRLHIPFLFYDFDKDFKFQDSARDLRHNGPQSNRLFAEHILSTISIDNNIRKITINYDNKTEH